RQAKAIQEIGPDGLHHVAGIKFGAKARRQLTANQQAKGRLVMQEHLLGGCQISLMQPFQQHRQRGRADGIVHTSSMPDIPGIQVHDCVSSVNETTAALARRRRRRTSSAATPAAAATAHGVILVPWIACSALWPISRSCPNTSCTARSRVCGSKGSNP